MSDDPQADLDELTQRNAERMQQFAQQGVQVNFMAPFIDHLVDTLFPEGGEARIAFLTSWQLKFTGMLDDVEQQVRRQRLLAPGAQIPNGQRP